MDIHTYSRLTLQCYLNHDFTGGELALVEPDADGPGVARETNLYIYIYMYMFV